jgi:hypothetical protein
MPWLFNEDAAMKARLQGLLVQDATSPSGGREVPVRYRLPDDELANLTYPVVIIEHAGIYPAQERMHSGYVQLPYAPEGSTPYWQPGEAIYPLASPYYAPVPTPYNFDYQVTVFGRFWGAHIAPLIGELATLWRLPAKAGRLWVPQDSTTRTMRLLGGPEEGYGTDEDGKKLFKVVYLVRVFSELVENVASSTGWGGSLTPVNTVDIDLSVYASLDDIDLSSPTGIQESIGIYSVGASSTVNVQQSP